MYDSDFKKNDLRKSGLEKQDFGKEGAGQQNPGARPAAQPDHLLDELTSIRALLDGDQRGEAGTAAGTDIPMLDDVVGFAASFKAVEAEPAPALFDLDGIFGDDSGELDPASTRLAFPKFTLDVAVSDAPIEPAGADDRRVLPPQANRREALIEELVAEFLPQIEATLRERLAGLDDDLLRTVKKPD